jgi:hypothetical protein
MKNYENLTLEQVTKAMQEFFGKELTLEELKAKILDGYSYEINGRVHTGKGGVLMFIDACVQEDLAPFMIQAGIKVFIPEHGLVPLKDLNPTKKP